MVTSCVFLMVAVFVLVGFQLFSLICLFSGWFPFDRASLDSRMYGYAKLKGACGPSICQNKESMDVVSFEVVLGTLKKVEQKNSVLNAILLIAVSVTASGLIENGSHPDTLLVCFLTLQIAPLFLSFFGIRQIDQWDFVMRRPKADDDVPGFLRKELERDLLRKECIFRFNKISVASTFVGFLVLLLLKEWTDILGTV